MIDYASIGLRIRQLRISKHLTQDELGEYVGLSAKHISNIETNNAHPSIESLVAIANRLDCSLDYILVNEAEKMQTFNFQIEFEQIMQDCTAHQRVILMDHLRAAREILKKHAIK